MNRIKDLTGKKIFRLKVLEYAYQNKDKRAVWKCLCDCGTVKNIIGTELTRKRGIDKRSCGCYHIERSTIHGCTGTTEYLSWQALKQRCDYKKHIEYKRYGGRGITYSSEWASFSNFIKDMGKKPSKKHSLDRIDYNGNYCKENCRWATQTEQANNTRRNNNIEYKGKIQSISAWSRETGIHLATISSRKKSGLTPEQIFNHKKNAKIKGKY